MPVERPHMTEDDAMVVLMKLLTEMGEAGAPKNEQERILMRALRRVILSWCERME